MKKIFIYNEEEKCKNYADAVNLCGGQPVFSKDVAASEGCDALLLTGGGDVDPSVYHQENNGSFGIDPERDRAEQELIRLFLADGRPIFGICRGIQILNAALGGDLIQDLPTSPTHKWDEETGDRVHLIRLTEDSFLRPLYESELEGDMISVNSAHHQGLDHLAEGLIPVAYAPDGVIEAVQDPARKIYAVQFHPERMSFTHARPDTVDGRRIFEFFLSLLG